MKIIAKANDYRYIVECHEDEIAKIVGQTYANSFVLRLSLSK